MYNYFKMDEKFSAAVSVELMSVGALLMHTKVPRGKRIITRLYCFPALVAHTLREGKKGLIIFFLRGGCMLHNWIVKFLPYFSTLLFCCTHTHT